MYREAGTPTELELARERLARSRAEVRRHFRVPGGQGAGRVSPFLRVLAVRGLQALVSGPGSPGGGGVRLGLAITALVTLLLFRGRSRRGGLGLAVSLALALMRFSRRR